MSKTKAAGATHYEILFILPNKFTDDEAKSLATKVGQTLTDNGGTITHTEYWGKKKLAYEIKHNVYGYYGLFEFDLERESLAKVDQALRLSTDVLRHMIVAKKAKTAEQIARNEAIRAKIDSKKAAEEKQQQEKTPKEEPKSETPKTEDKRANLKDLDEKLEGILNAEDLL